MRAIMSGQIVITEAKQAYSMEFAEILSLYIGFKQAGADGLGCGRPRSRRTFEEGAVE